MGLRYINKLKIPLNDGPVDISKFTKPYYDTEMLRSSEIRAVHVEARITRKGKSLTIRSGIQGESTNQERFLVYLLDYDCYRGGENIKQEMRKLLSTLHSTIEKQFLADVEKSYKDYMIKGTWS